MNRIISLFIFFWLFLSLDSAGITPHRWQSLESEHFIITYNKNSSYLLRDTFLYAEEIADKLGSFGGEHLVKSRIHIVLYDDEDFANGSAYRLYPLVKVYARKMNDLWRGETQWLKNLLFHELSHIYSLRMISKERVLYFGAMAESETANIDGSIIYSHVKKRLPAWFVEGIAQTGSQMLGADRRDPYREMLLRDAWQSGRLLSLREMERLEGSSRDYELAYNQGFDLAMFILNGSSTDDIQRLCGYVSLYGLDDALKQLYDRDRDDFYSAWLESLSNRFHSQADGMTDHKEMFRDRQGPYISELSSAGSGRYVIANWRNDFNMYSLFRSSRSRKTAVRKARNAGRLLKVNPAGDAWYFVKEKVISSKGAKVYDLYWISSRGFRRRITRNERVTAFAPTAEGVYYARYSSGTNTIIHCHDGNKIPLGTIDYPLGVYDMAVSGSNELIVSYGDGTSVKAARYIDGKLENIWDNDLFDILDVRCTGDRYLFVSTCEGSPQLYWAYMAEPDTWYRVTSAAAGVRYPSVTGAADEEQISISVFQHGNFKRMLLDDPFRTNQVLYPEFAPRQAAESNRPGIQTAEKRTSLMSEIWPRLGYIISYYDRDTSVGYERGLDTSALYCSWSMFNAPQSFQAGLDLILRLVVVPYINPWLVFHLWRFRFDLDGLLTYDGERESNDIEIVTLRDVLQVFNAGITYDLKRYSIVNFNYSLLNRNYKIKGRIIDSRYSYTDGTKEFKLNFYHYCLFQKMTAAYQLYIPLSARTDPATLGGSSFSLFAEGSCNINSYSEEFFPSGYLTKDTTFADFQAGAMQRILSPRNKFSLSLGGDYLRNYAPRSDNRYYYDTFAQLGYQDFFSAYHYVPIRESLRVFTELKLNPFVNNANGIKASERWNIGSKVEYGFVRDIFKNNKWLNPLSLEFSLNYDFYLKPDVPSNLYFIISFPLTDPFDYSFKWADIDDFRIYFGIQL